MNSLDIAFSCIIIIILIGLCCIVFDIYNELNDRDTFCKTNTEFTYDFCYKNYQTIIEEINKKEISRVINGGD